MARVPDLDAVVWLHDGFSASQVQAMELATVPRGGFGVAISLPNGGVYIAFGPDRALTLAEQETAARKAAGIFTRIADRLAEQHRPEQETTDDGWRPDLESVMVALAHLSDFQDGTWHAAMRALAATDADRRRAAGEALRYVEEWLSHLDGLTEDTQDDLQTVHSALLWWSR